MRRSGLIFAAILTITAMGTAQAVHLDPGGRGQVLLYPYYTVNKNQQTLLSVVNTSSAAQAVKVRINEGYNGRDVLDFNLFLSPFDSWSATIFALRDAGIDDAGAAILTRDTSCTAPLFAEDMASINGTPYVYFRPFAYQSPGDGGPYTIDRTREGMIEIIAMSNVAAPLSSAIAHGSNGSPPTGCGQVRNLTGSEPEVSSAPSGGLMGTVSIINVGQGTVLSARAEALGGFTATSLFTPAVSLLPDLASVNDGSGALASRATARIFDATGKAQELTYPGPDTRSRRVDAVSAVLMADRVFNEYQISEGLAAASDWIVTFPTKPFYVDPLYLGASPTSAAAPFTRIYNGSATASSRFAPTEFDLTFYSPNGQFNSESCPAFTGFTCTPALQFVTNVFPIHKGSLPYSSDVLGSQLSTARPFYGVAVRHRPTTESGTLSFDLNFQQERHQLLPSMEGKVLNGLPVVGYWASNIVNNNVRNGVLANYAAAVRHATSVTCVKASDGMPCD